MVWARLDDGSIDHLKFRHAERLLGGRNAFARVWTCWTAGLVFANRVLSDGFLPRSAVLGFAQYVEHPLKIADVLIEAGLWKLHDGGYLIHDFDKSNIPAATVKREREANARRQARFRVRHEAEGARVSNGVINGVTHDVTNACPDPGPDPTPIPERGDRGAGGPSRLAVTTRGGQWTPVGALVSESWKNRK